MILRIIHKSVSVLMAFLLLLSTLSLTVEKHFCGDVLVDVAIFLESEKCAMEAFEVTQETITKKPCCKDEIDIIQGQDEMVTKTSDDLNIFQQQLLLAYSISYINLFEGLPKAVVPHKEYSPPIITKDIQILDEVFLI